MLFSILIGTGIQIFAMVVFLLIFACLGLISPAHRGAVLSTFYFFFIFLSNLSGYYSARFYKMFLGTDWAACAALVSCAYPLVVFSAFFTINLANWAEGSSSAMSFPTMLVLLFVYCALSIPNVWFGSFIGYKKTIVKNPGKVNRLSKDIPGQPWYLRMKILVPLGGILPFV